MDAAERGLLKTRQSAAQANLRETKQFALVGAVVSFGLLPWVFVLLLRENGRRRPAGGALQKSNEELECRGRRRTA